MFTVENDLQVFARTLSLKRWFHKEEQQCIFDTVPELNFERILEELAAEDESTMQEIGKPPKFPKGKS